ncbi:MAG: DUF3035 domain-containing protein [Geminicoccaceae bacterium]|nr:DUF3035 domain-containing protein [Geminicoccaceae bacterium]
MPWSPSRGLVGLVLAGLVLAGCQGTVQEAFGLRKRPPDEFQVVRGQPLVVPPDRRLRPPQPGAVGPAEVDPARAARETLVGRAGELRAPGGASPGEAALLRAAKGEADPDIRRRLAEEDGQLAYVDERTFLFILDWQRRRAQAPEARGEPLDPVAEARRLQESGRVQTVRRTTESGG